MRSSHLSRRVSLSVLGLVAVSSLSLFAGSAQASPKQTPYTTGRANAGTSNSSSVTKNSAGQVVKYGNKAITYTLPPAELEHLGQALYQQNCASCHGADANGQPENSTRGSFPNLQGLGPATIDFWIESGRMPAKDTRNVEAIRKTPVLTHHQALAIAAWIDSLTGTPGYPYIPQPNLSGGSVSVGASLFALNCAACHTITGDGDALAFDTYAPSLRNIPAVQVTEAIRTGPGNMPRFTGNLSDNEVRDITKYVTQYIQHPTNPGGLGLGGLGPVAEGFVGLALGVGLLALAAFWIGERQ